jgi:amino acid transporter
VAFGVKRVLVGRTISSYKLEHQLLPKSLALPVFSSDPLSSVAYATEEMMLVLVVAGAGALTLKIPIAAAIAALLAIVVASYRQTVRAYPHGGGSYIVARENLGTLPGLIAAAAILSDYVLTVAVSVTAGTIAITSAAPTLTEHKVLIAISLVGLLTLANLRGVREAGFIFAIPTYGFVAIVYVMIAVGFVRCLSSCPVADTAHLPLEPLGALTLFLALRAFASGATALTGVEAIADGVQAFRRPQSKNAAATLSIMATIAITMFIGITVLTQVLHVRVNEDIAVSRSVLSQIGETVFGRGLLFFVLQALTAGILILAANTSFQDFPRLSAILARDRFMPSQFRTRGNRLVFSNGVLVLAVLAALLIYLFDAELTRLIQLYVVGVFTAFTLSQTGMVVRWRRVRGEGWRRSMAINAVGAAVTAVVLVIVALTKFTRGAWIVIAVIPLIVTFFLAVHRHYEAVGEALGRAAGGGSGPGARPDGAMENTFYLIVRSLDAATLHAVAYLRGLRPERVMPLFVGARAEFPAMAREWSLVAPRLGSLRLVDETIGNGASTREILRYLQERSGASDEFRTLIVPESLSGGSLLQLLSPRSAFWLKAALLLRGETVVTDIPLRAVPPTGDGARPRPAEPGREVVLIPVSAVHAGTARAVRYARTLHAAHVEGLFFSSDAAETQEILDAWADWRMGVPLTVVDDPFRDLLSPLLHEIRSHTTRPDTVVTVVLPELVVRHWWEHLLHNQTGLSIKRLLLFEPNVVVTSVPFRLWSDEGDAGEAGRAGRPPGQSQDAPSTPSTSPSAIHR